MSQTLSASTLLAVLFVPAFFVVFQSLAEWWGHGRPPQADLVDTPMQGVRDDGQPISEPHLVVATASKEGD